MPEIHHYSLTPDTVSSVLAFLSPHLPHTLSLYRRLQFGNFSPSAQLLSTVDFSAGDALSYASDTGAKWTIAFVDRSRRPETEVFQSSSWENNTTTYDDIAHDGECHALVADLLAAIAGLPTPPPPHSESQNEAQTQHEDNIYTSHLASPRLVLLGAVHDTTARLIRDAGVLSPATATVEKDGLPEAYHRWVFALHSSAATISSDRFPLHEGLVFGELRERDFGLVRSRTLIPRQDRTLRRLPRVAVYDCIEADGMARAPVAWAFLGVDGSLSALHVEERYRGRGVARAVAVRLWERELGVFTGTDGGERWASADVATYNRESNAVCKGLGGEVAYIDYWLRVDLEKVR